MSVLGTNNNNNNNNKKQQQQTFLVQLYWHLSVKLYCIINNNNNNQNKTTTTNKQKLQKRSTATTNNNTNHNTAIAESNPDVELNLHEPFTFHFKFVCFFRSVILTSLWYKFYFAPVTYANLQGSVMFCFARIIIDSAAIVDVIL